MKYIIQAVANMNFAFLAISHFSFFNYHFIFIAHSLIGSPSSYSECSETGRLKLMDLFLLLQQFPQTAV